MGPRPVRQASLVDGGLEMQEALALDGQGDQESGKANSGDGE